MSQRCVGNHNLSLNAYYGSQGRARYRTGSYDDLYNLIFFHVVCLLYGFWEIETPLKLFHFILRLEISMNQPTFNILNISPSNTEYDPA